MSRRRTHPTYKQILFQLLGGKCASCGTTEKLQIHHKDGNPFNNTLDNLELLCLRCHRRIHSDLKINSFFLKGHFDEFFFRKHGLKTLILIQKGVSRWKELIKLIPVANATLSRTLNELQIMGLIKKQKIGRRTKYSITSKGEELLRKLYSKPI